MDIIQYVQEHPYEVASAVVGVYEVLARYIPTEGNWTILYNLVKLLDFLVKNRAKEQGTYLETTTTVVAKEIPDQVM